MSPPHLLPPPPYLLSTPLSLHPLSLRPPPSAPRILTSTVVNMTGGNRRCAVRHSPDLSMRKSLKKRTKGFVRQDQRLPESPPLPSAHPPSRGIMAAVRARYRVALDLLFGTLPRVLNSVCVTGVTGVTARDQNRQQPNRHQEAPASQHQRAPHHSVPKRKRLSPPSSPSSGAPQPQSDSDQVVPHHVVPLPLWTPINQPVPCTASHKCSCSDALWNAGGIGPEVMLRTAEELSESIFVLYSNAIDPETGDVNYSSLMHSTDFRQYLASAQKLRYFDPLLLNNVERKAFFLNIYNSLMIHAIAVMSKPRTMYERVSLYNTAAYNIGGRPYSLNAIEHGVLRANRRGCGPFAQRQFSDTDARRQCMLPTVDPRIHFALNCGARSCPTVRFYESDNIDKTLDAATRAYLTDVDVSYENRTITLPKILHWYQVDFCGDGEVDSAIKWTLQYLDNRKRDVINSLLREKEESNECFKVVYAGYDWTVNDSSI